MKDTILEGNFSYLKDISNGTSNQSETVKGKFADVAFRQREKFLHIFGLVRFMEGEDSLSEDVSENFDYLLNFKKLSRDDLNMYSKEVIRKAKSVYEGHWINRYLSNQNYASPETAVRAYILDNINSFQGDLRVDLPFSVEDNQLELARHIGVIPEGISDWVELLDQDFEIATEVTEFEGINPGNRLLYHQGRLIQTNQEIGVATQEIGVATIPNLRTNYPHTRADITFFIKNVPHSRMHPVDLLTKQLERDNCRVGITLSVPAKGFI